jgi:molybdopterin synthase catalytic subunit
MIEITRNPIDEAAVLASVKSTQAGAQLLFVGSTREFTTEAGVQKQTTQLQYDCYDEMAISQMQLLARQARDRWNLTAVSLVHRIGPVALGESSVVIAVSSPHRDDAFQAGRWLIDTLKQQVPIWKQENWIDGTSEWVHPQQSSEHKLNGSDVEHRNESAAADAAIEGSHADG